MRSVEKVSVVRVVVGAVSGGCDVVGFDDVDVLVSQALTDTVVCRVPVASDGTVTGGFRSLVLGGDAGRRGHHRGSDGVGRIVKAEHGTAGDQHGDRQQCAGGGQDADPAPTSRPHRR